MTQANIESSSRSAGRLAAAESDYIQQYLTFVLSGEVFAIGILAIKEIIEYANVTPVPMTPAYTRGVINLRGAVVPVLDLSVRFGRSASEVTKRTCIVIIEVGAGRARQDIGIGVPAVGQRRGHAGTAASATAWQATTWLEPATGASARSSPRQRASIPSRAASPEATSGQRG